MKATEARFLEFLKSSPQFVIPIYQRAYSWTERECKQLWDDILRVGRDDCLTAHFVGSIVYVERGLYQVSSHSPLLVIDGQQRLTTVMLIIEALARLVGDDEPVDGFSAVKLRNYYLLNPYENGERRYKLILSQTDKKSLMALLDHTPLPKDYSLRLKGNFEFFTKCLEEVKDELVAVCKGLAKLVIVDISLDREQDNPQLIFESLNSTGRELSQADLIRNFVLMGLEPEIQTRLYELYWRPMEQDFGQEAYASDFDSFMRHYLTVRTGNLPNVKEVYEAFKRYAHSGQAADLEELVKDIKTFAGYYCAMAFGAETEPDLKKAFEQIRELKTEVAYPFLLELYHDYRSGLLAKKELAAIVGLVESYIFRRAVCSISAQSMNKTFATFSRTIDKDNYLASVKAHFLSLRSYRRFPNDEEFARELKTRDLYNFRNRTYWLRRMENYGRKEPVAVDEYSIEHIMPQTDNLSERWKADLGFEWQRVHETWLHTLGNLTLTGYNSEYSDRPFSEKRDMEGGFKESPLRLNNGLGQLDIWNEEFIRQRATHLAAKALVIWPKPDLAPDVLDSYTAPSRDSNYTLEDHPHIAGGAMTEFFDAFRKEVLALDPCVTEEFLKLYVAYKAETNFVDVVPQAKRLKLLLNMPFVEISDPRGVCKNVADLGRWGNGEVEVGLSSLADLPYIMGLVRQSLEWQLAGGRGREE